MLEDRLKDPGITKGIDRFATTTSALTAAGSGYLTGVSLLLAIPTGGASLIPAALGAANATLSGAINAQAREEALRPESVYFKL
jgi:hypothetical protein